MDTENLISLVFTCSKDYYSFNLSQPFMNVKFTLSLLAQSGIRLRAPVCRLLLSQAEGWWGRNKSEDLGLVSHRSFS